ncbi:TldD/PmbA family protein [Polyangium mundeleinium]|uniref:TldD/PmbA family protein n=1 Tax=Polyangium mundeleinium TaxID=2995306 RepID=A0ABT5EX76_9BACT|nr:TldD/PmbA family protein [Polyangium mundeleinium]MDC0746401.1 TldD/PmbA family protein [Polyangium mundeleinium]
MTNEAMLQIARNAVSLAKQKGAAEVAAVARVKRDVDVTWRDGKLEKITEATSRGLEVRLYVDGRYSTCSTSDLRPEGLASFLDNAIGLTRTLAKDPHRSLPDPALYAKATPEGLSMADPKIESITALDLRRTAQSMEEAARSVKGSEAILSVTTNGYHSWNETTQVHSNGLEASFAGTEFSISADVSIKDDDGRRPEEGEYAWVRLYADLPDAAAVGRRATERALARRGAKKAPSSVMPVLIDNRAAGRFLSYLLRPLTGAALQQKRSFFEGLVGKPFGSDKLDFADDPLLPKGLGTRPFDGEGLAARRMPLFEKGVLKNHYIDTYYGKKLSMAPTTGGSTNIAWKLGPKTQAALALDVKEGLLITSFLGGNSNDATGDFSLGVQGFVIRGGKIGEPIAEMNVSGRHVDVWKRLIAVGNDPFAYGASRTPTLVFDGMQVAGT